MNEELFLIPFLMSIVVFIAIIFLIYNISYNLEDAGQQLNNTSLSNAGRSLLWIVAIQVIILFILFALYFIVPILLN